MRRILLLIISSSLYISCQVENINYTKPVVVTYQPENVLTTSATLGGLVVGEGGKDISEYGIVYSTGNTPTINDHKIKTGERLGEYFQRIDVFEPGTTYSYSFYATNEEGTAYGDIYNFTTTAHAPCQPAKENFLDTNWYTMDIDEVQKENHPFDGNVEFLTSTYDSTTRISLRFNEIDGKSPFTGTYKSTLYFDSLDPKSDGKVIVQLNGYLGWEQSSSAGMEDTEIYVENIDGKVTFIFCDFKMSGNYTLDGKFTYTE